MKTAGIAGERSVLADNAVARNHDRHRVVVVRHPYSAGCRGLAERFRDIAVRAGLPVRNSEQFIPHGLLEWSSFNIQRNLESSPLSFKVLRKLLHNLAVGRVIHDRTFRDAVPEMDRR